MHPSFERVAARLTTLQLRGPLADALDGPDEPLFVRTYSAAGIRTVLEEYGLQAKLEERGLGDVDIAIHADDPYRHRLELRLPGGELVMDLRLHLCAVGLPGDPAHIDVVVVEWLLMQNPRRSFTAERPRLPGQTHPGTGLGADVSQLLVLLCRRIGRAALVTVPEKFHLAELYRRAGYVAANADDDAELDEVLRATSSLSFAERAWAVERGHVRDDAGKRYGYAPHDRVLLVDDAVHFTPLASSRAVRTLRLDALDGARGVD